MTINEFFTNLASGASWAAGVSFQRSNPLPLDKYSVFQSEADLVTYVTTNAVAYPGQIVAVYDATSAEMRAFVISSVGENGTYIPVGTETVVDGKSIAMKEDGSLELAGFSAADGLTLPQKQADGSIAWVTIDAIVKGDGNTKYSLSLDGNSLMLKSDDGSDDSEAIDLSKYLDNTDTTYSLSQEGMVVTLTPSEGEAQSVTIDAYNKKEIDDKFAALPEDKDTTYTAKSGDKVLKLEGTEFSTELGLKHENGKISLTGISGEVIAEFSDAEFVADGVLEDVSYNAETKELTFTWNTKDAEGNFKTDVVNIADLIDTYTAGNGLELSGSEFSVKLAAGSESFLSVDANGVKLSGVQAAIDAAEGRAASDAQSKANAAKEAAIADADGKLALKANASEVYTKTEADNLLNSKANSADVYTKSEVYTKGEADQAIADKITEVNGGESAGEVLGQLNAYKKIVNMEVWGSETAEGDSRIDDALARVQALENVGAQANVIEEVKAADDAKLVVTKSGKVVTIDDSALQNLITAAQNKANEATGAASNAQSTADANALTIAANDAAIKLLQAQDATHTGQITALQQHDNDHKAQYEALTALVGEHGTDIAGLKTGKADVSVTDALAGRVSANEQAIKTLNETTVPGINAELALMAKSADVYNKTEIDGKVTVLEQAIADAKAEATYDDSAVRELIAGNTQAIADLTNGAVKANTDAIAALAEQVGNVSNIMNFVGAKASIPSAEENSNYASGDVIIVGNQEYVFDGSAWQAFGDASVNGALISALDERVSANEAAILAINDTEKGILAQAKGYVNTAIETLPFASGDVAGLVKYDDKSIKMNENKQLYVAEVSTDLLTIGSKELRLCAGGASI